jgi:hypothetical protein
VPIGKFRQTRSPKLSGTLLSLAYLDDFDMLGRNIHATREREREREAEALVVASKGLVKRENLKKTEYMIMT